MAKELTLPTPPAAPSAPRVSIGDRIHGIENRIQEIESIGGTHQKANTSNSDRRGSNDSTKQTQSDEQGEQVESKPQTTQPQQQRQPSSRTVTTPENMARDAVANGSGALTKRTTTRKPPENAEDTSKNESHKNQSTIVVPPDSAFNDTGQTKFERGRAVLNEFKQLDKENQSKSAGSQTQSSTVSPGLFAPSNEGAAQHSVVYWLFTFIAVGILAFAFVKQFMLKESSDKSADKKEAFKPTLQVNPPMSTTSQIKSKANTSLKTSPIKNSAILAKDSSKVAAPKPLTIKPKTEDDKKGKHFEVRV